MANWLCGTTNGGHLWEVEECRDGDRNVVRAELPGTDPGRDVDVSVGHGVLRLRDRRRGEQRDQRRTGAHHDSLERRGRLPEGSTTDEVDAGYADGAGPPAPGAP
ncbi:Hsp20 family protein [Nocardioides plantarum]|uniref:Hsp20 family protein n=1 Tax=Nocardioides plantarum TaxID=29299 RepID=UPI003CCC6D1B